MESLSVKLEIKIPENMLLFCCRHGAIFVQIKLTAILFEISFGRNGYKVDIFSYKKTKKRELDNSITFVEMRD